MSFLHDIRAGKKSISLNSGIGTPRSFPGMGDGRRLWREVFGGITKEDQNAFPASRPIPGGSWGRGVISEAAAYKRFLQSMRSMAPGGWTDNRWEQQKHFVGVAYACIHRTGEQLACSEFTVYEQLGPKPDDKVEAKQGTRAYDLVDLLQKPNNDDNWGDVAYWINQQMDLEGMGLMMMVPNLYPHENPDPRFQGTGTPNELYVIPTATAIPQPAINPDYPDGYYRVQPLYPYGPFSSYPTPATAVGAPIPAQWMLRFKYPHPLVRYDGYSPLSALRKHIDEIEAIDDSRWYKMKNTFNPNVVLQMEEFEGAQPLPEWEIERMRVEFEQFQGPQNVGRLFVSPPGGRLEEFGKTAADMEYQNGWSQLVDFVMGAGFGITKPAAGMVEDSSYSTLFATLKQFHMLTLNPKCRRLGAVLTRHLAPFFGKNLVIEVKPPRIDDHEVALNKANSMADRSACTYNTYLKLIGEPPTKEPWGEERMGQQEQQAMEGMPQPGMGGGLDQPENLTPPPGAEAMQNEGQGPLPDEARAEPPEMMAGRDNAGPLAAGSRNPLKSLYGSKSLNINGRRFVNKPKPRKMTKQQMLARARAAQANRGAALNGTTPH